ncbi:hypothetical protein SRABI106_03914 [Rahnella aquatilis]|nr:hypothetical protein SRABI106_03914 [Rahnella aquatilis]
MGMQNDIAAGHFVIQTIHQNFFCTEVVTTVNQMHFRGNIGQIKSFFNSGVATADNRDFLVAIEEAITGCAG